MKKDKVAFFHLYNDYSGSPKVLCNVIEGLLGKYSVRVITSNSKGVLDELAGNADVEYDYFNYQPTNNKIVWMLKLLWAQICLFFKAFKCRDCRVFYINTIMPVGAALAGKLMCKRIVYHYHENAFIKSALYRFLCKIMLSVADEIICVSDYQRSFLPQKENISVVQNALPVSFTDKLLPDVERAYAKKSVLMVSSLLIYKGLLEYISLAQKLYEYNFVLVVNDTDAAIKNFVEKYNVDVPINLKIYPRQSDVSKFYNEASLLLNLSDRTKVIETFGMTVLEGMSAGVPVIVPTVGGIAELVKDGVNGYKIDVQELDSIANRIDEMFSNKDVYCELANGALKTATLYSCTQMCDKIDMILSACR